MKKNELLSKTDKEEALASLHAHAGWQHLKYMLEEKEEQLMAQMYAVDPRDAVDIASMQAQLKLIREIKAKPKKYFLRKKNKN